MRSTSLVTLVLALSLTACGGDDGTGTGIDAAVTIDVAALPDIATLPDSAAAPDAFPQPANAMSLGQVCSSAMACPMGYTCLLAMTGATTGFCSLPCPGDMDSICQDMFPGPGTAACDFTVPPMVNFCGIRCGTQWSPPLPPDCPTGLTCLDLTGTMGMPDTLTDFCAPGP